MDAVIKNKWIERLESGELKQGIGHLHDLKADTYCCLGVLCDIASDDGIVERKPANISNLEQFIGEHGPSVGLLPDDVQNWAGIRGPDAPFKMGDRWTTLAIENDNGKSFTEIAQMIRENF